MGLTRGIDMEALAERWHGSAGGRLRLSLGPVLPWVVDLAEISIDLGQPNLSMRSRHHAT